MRTKLLFILLMLPILVAHSQPGAIDLSFNPNGVGAYGGSLPPNYEPNVDGLVYKSRIYNSGIFRDRMLIVGRFSSFNGVPKKYIARLTQNGAVDNSFSGPSFSAGYIYCLQILPDNKILVAGMFSVTSGATTYRNIVRLNPDGSLDTSFNSGSGTRGTNAEIHALTMQNDGKILIGGKFTLWNGAGNRRLIRLNDDGSLDPTFTSTGTVNSEVRTIVVQNIGENQGKIVIGGFFSGFTGVTKQKLLRLHPNGDYDTTFNQGGNGATGGDAVFDISLRSDDQMYVGGKFTHYNGVNKRSIFMVDANGNLVSTWNQGGIGVTNPETNVEPGSGYNIFTIKPQPNGEILIGGNFTEYNGTQLPKGLARLNIDGTLDTSFLTGTGFTGGTNVYQGKSVIRDIVLQRDGKIIVGGDFTDYDGTQRRMLARIKTRNCSETATYNSIDGWENGILPNSYDYLTIIESGMTVIPGGTHLKACELEVKQGATLIIESDASLTVDGKITINGTFTIESSGSLVQVKDDVNNVQTASGLFTVKRNTTPVTRYDYTYWSTPVKDPTLFNVSPNTLFDKYHKFNPVTNNWQTILNGSEIMTTGRGYIIRAPQTFSLVNPTVYTTNFVGVPNNGKYLVPVSTGPNASWNLLGNPYPSAIDINKFINLPDNIGKVGGTIYLWTHFSDIVSGPNGEINYSADDYAAYNRMGGVVTMAGMSNPFSGMVASGQAFFIEAQQTGLVSFSNQMRSAADNRQFYRINNEIDNETFQKQRLWLNLTNSQGAFNQALIGYATGATTGIDRDFDGKVFGGNYVSLYSIADSQNLTIQGRPLPFEISDEVVLGYKNTIAGTFEIALSEYDAEFENIGILLEDKTLNVVHNLRESAYSFQSPIGTFNNRFVLKYEAAALTAPGFEIGKSVTVVTSAEAIIVRSENIIKSVEIWDAIGRKIYVMNAINTDSHSVTHLNAANSVLIIKVTTEDLKTTIKKIRY